jgi:hypothetical protein
MAEYSAKDSDSASDRWLKEHSPLLQQFRDPEANAVAAQFLAERGIVPQPGRSALESVYRFLFSGSQDGAEDVLDVANTHRKVGEERMDRREALNRFAEMVNATPAEVKELLAAGDEAVTKHGLMTRLAKRDAETRDRPTPKSSPEEIRRDKASRSMRSALEQRYDELEAKDRAAAERRAAAARPVRETPPAPERERTPRERYNDSFRSSTYRALDAAADRLGIVDEDASSTSSEIESPDSAEVAAP